MTPDLIRQTAALLLLAGLLAGCGSDTANSSSVAPVKIPSAGTFSADLNGLCDEMTTAQNKAGPTARLFPVEVRYLQAFKLLRPPPRLRTIYAKFLANVERARKKIKAQQPQVAESIFYRDRMLALRLNAPACASLDLYPGFA